MALIDLHVIDLAAARGGVLTRSELIAAGASRRQIERMVATGLVHRVTPGVFVVRGHPTTWSQQVQIAAAQAGATCFLSCATAAVRWRFPRIGRGAVEVTIPRGTPPPRTTIGRVHVTRLPADDRSVTVLEGMRTATPSRTLLDLSARLNEVHLAECVVDLCHRGLVTLPQLAADLAAWRRPGLRGGPRLERVLEGCEDVPVTESFLETKFVALVRAAGLPMPRTQVEITVDGRTYRVDTLWDECSLIVELNGYGTHASRHQLAADAERAARLQAAGYEVVVFTFDQVIGSPRYVLAQVGRRLQAASAA
ncbi:MAG: AbiEi antitoxin N-terminal domain-containing protein [Aquihabitans sp.]